MMGRWAWHIEIDKRFEAFLRANYADEIAMMIDIAPDYISITKRPSKGHPRPIEHADRADYQRVRAVGQDRVELASHMAPMNGIVDPARLVS